MSEKQSAVRKRRRAGLREKGREGMAPPLRFSWKEEWEEILVGLEEGMQGVVKLKLLPVSQVTC